MSVIFVNADWSAIVPAGSPLARYGVQPKDVRRLGVDRLPTEGGAIVPNLPEPSEAPKVLTSANLTPEPEVKEAPTPANKAAPKPATKGTARKEPVDGDRR